MPEHVLAGIGRLGRKLARMAAETPGAAPKGLLMVDVDLGPTDATLSRSPVAGLAKAHSLASPSGRGTARSWLLGRLAHESTPPPPRTPAERLTLVFDAADGTGAGAGPGVLRDLVRHGPDDAFRLAVCLLPRATDLHAGEMANAAFALGALARARADAVAIVDPAHLAQLRSGDADPFRVGELDDEETIARVTTDVLRALHEYEVAGWAPRDFRNAFRTERAPAFVAPAYVRIQEADLARVNLLGWVVSTLEGGALADALIEGAQALIVSIRLPNGWSKHPGFRAADEIASVLRAIAPDARVDVDVHYGSQTYGEVRGFVVGAPIPRVTQVARAGALEAMEPDFAKRVEGALAAVGSVEPGEPDEYQRAFEDAARALEEAASF